MAARNIDILWIAPSNDRLPALGWLDELGEIAQIRGVTMRTVSGRVATAAAIADALSTSGCEVIIWSGHGQEDGLVTADNRILSGEWIATQARAGAPEAFLVGACYSGARGEFLDSITEQIAQAGIHAIGFMVAADDNAAAVYACEFVRALVADADVTRANRVAIRAAAQINRQTAVGVTFHAAIMDGYRSILAEIKGVRAATDLLSGRVERVERSQSDLIKRFDECLPPPGTKRSSKPRTASIPAAPA